MQCPWTETVLYKFAMGADGAYPGYGDVVFDQNGNLYDTDPGAGAGVVFELSPSDNGWTLTVLYSAPFGQVTLDASGNLYGTASQGGANNVGVVWEITP